MFAYLPHFSCAVLVVFTPELYANSLSEKDALVGAVSAELNTITITAEQVKKEVGQHTYSKEDLERTPNTQKTITDFLKVNPNVQFSNTALSGGTQGELTAQEISINGALFYDNKFLVNNLDIGNHLNPVSSGDAGATSLAGGGLSATMNTDLLCELEVLDSNISAEYGEFMGGVVKAKTCSPKTKTGEVHGSVSYDYTNSDWSNIHFIDDEEFDDFEKNTDATYQKDFVKQGISATVYGKARDDLGISVSASRRWSDIGLTANLANQPESNQQRQIDHLNANIYYDFNDKNKLNVGLYLQNETASKKINNIQSGSYESKKNNFALDAAFMSDFDHFKLQQNIVLQRKQMLKDSASNEAILWNHSADKPWGTGSTSTQGGYGDLASTENNVEYTIKAELEPLAFLKTNHLLKFGAGYQHQEANWERPESAFMYYPPIKNMGLGISSCTTNDGQIDKYCDLSYDKDGIQGQYLAKRYHYQAGENEVVQDNVHAFFEDQIHWQNYLKMRLGVRYDYDSIAKKHNVAPRTNLQILPFGNASLVLTGGWNRYYGNNSFSYQLEDGVNALTIEERRNSINDDWIFYKNVTGTNVGRSALDTPYADETVWALSSDLGNVRTQVKYVHRDNKNQIRKNRVEGTEYTYTNQGQSQADTYTFEIGSIQPFSLWGSENRISLAADYTDIKRNFNDYNDSLFNNEDVYIRYNGKIIENVDRPADNFARPWSARLMLDTQFKHIPLTINHLFRYRSSYDAMTLNTLKGQNIIQYKDEFITKDYLPTRVKDAFTWDIRANYALNTGKKTSTILGLTVNNLLDAHHYYLNSEGRKVSEMGRQFIADISFKF
ncbi:TonB-dependent receptor plug domain-containing protein [Acinetobacter lanii]|uniref:TonB-dependent receptor plug domain-containing protein n=1 Tax=Acinetobacter lanii TaxID=2715163 RepID=A0A6G8S2Y0_9GAMM|nr:TonB-dependent receptor plug domain-containing protein [Acinetobacter lanii]QIO08532.1 TonB-dependent receptor plug domain-containing protein [Acinetobacter lanii]